MADSVDRVFGHALNTVNKIRSGSQKPPVADRLKLYGLYKQSMEGDVDGVQTRPTGTSPEADKERDKWDAWHAHRGLTRTEAKRRYISTLIETMHKYASSAPDARELVSELEFVWDQIKNNSNGSSSSRSSPAHERTQEHAQEAYAEMGGGSSAAAFETDKGGGGGGAGSPRGAQQQQQQQMRVLSPVSQGEAEEEREEFVDAPVSQYDVGDMLSSSAEDKGSKELERHNNDPSAAHPPRRPPPTDPKWRRQISASLIKLTAEVAALREQLESRRYFSQRRRHSLLGWLLRASWFAVKLALADLFALWLVILWMRRKKDRRLEGAVRVLLGDAVAQVQRVGREIQLPKLPIGRGS
ncbi:hypothetical protein LTR50_002633 [Elasticomyces elasticus]|nr:hypothetical protein LTR50_002633 [Elasticomyces elasticus]